MTQNAKITFVLPNLGGGGAERVTVSLANAIAARGIETTFVVGQAEGPYLKDVDDRVRLVDLQVPQIRKAVPGLIKHFNTDKPDAVLSALTHANLAVLVAAQRANKGPRIIVAEHNSTKMLMHGNKLPKRMLKRYMIRKFYPRADDIVLVSRDMRPDFAKFISLPVERFTPIHNPIMPPPPPDPTYQIHPWLQEKTTPVVVGAGRLSTQKDFGTLIKAFDKMRDRTSARLVIFGEGPDREKRDSLSRPTKLARKENREALALHRAGKYAEAQAGFARAVEASPGHDLARFNLACAYARLGKLDEAATELTTLLERDLLRFQSRWRGDDADPDLDALRELEARGDPRRTHRDAPRCV